MIIKFKINKTQKFKKNKNIFKNENNNKIKLIAIITPTIRIYNNGQKDYNFKSIFWICKEK